MSDPVLESVAAGVYTVPPKPRGDGTLTWDVTTLVLARVQADGVDGLACPPSV
jgi:hypothetical protein